MLGAADDEAAPSPRCRPRCSRDAILLALRDQRPDLGGGSVGIADRSAATTGGRAPRRTRRAGWRARGPGSARCTLAAVAHARDAHAGRHVAGIGVVEDDGRGLAAQLQADLVELAAQASATWRPAAVDPVNDTLSTPGCRHQVSRPPRDRREDADDARREAGLLEHLGQQQRVERRLRAGFTTTVHPASSAGISFADDEELRHVPRDDRGDDADRLPSGCDDVLSEQPGRDSCQS